MSDEMPGFDAILQQAMPLQEQLVAAQAEVATRAGWVMTASCGIRQRPTLTGPRRNRSRAAAQADPAVAVPTDLDRVELAQLAVLRSASTSFGELGLGGEAAEVDRAVSVAEVVQEQHASRSASSARCTSTPGGAGTSTCGAGAAADLGALPQRADHPLEPGQQRARVVALRR